jgi:hypothetical protein
LAPFLITKRKSFLSPGQIPLSLKKNIFVEVARETAFDLTFLVIIATRFQVQCYETFYNRNLKMFIVSYIVFPLHAFPAYAFKSSSLEQKGLIKLGPGAIS